MLLLVLQQTESGTRCNKRRARRRRRRGARRCGRAAGERSGRGGHNSSKQFSGQLDVDQLVQRTEIGLVHRSPRLRDHRLHIFAVRRARCALCWGRSWRYIKNTKSIAYTRILREREREWVSEWVRESVRERERERERRPKRTIGQSRVAHDALSRARPRDSWRRCTAGRAARAASSSAPRP